MDHKSCSKRFSIKIISGEPINFSTTIFIENEFRRKIQANGN
jgi:hypothetical protein